MRVFYLYILLSIQVTLLGQKVILPIDFNNYDIEQQNELKFLTFEKANYNDELIPYFTKQFPNKYIERINFKILSSAPITTQEANCLSDKQFGSHPEIFISNGIANLENIGQFNLYPFFLKNNTVHKVLSGEAIIYYSEKQLTTNNKQLEEVNNSVLQSGEWFKFSVGDPGVYTFSYEDLIKNGVISKPIDKGMLGVYSNSSKMLPFIVGQDKYDDLLKHSIYFKDTADPEFNEGDEIWTYIEANGYNKLNFIDTSYTFETNLFSDSNYVYLTTSDINSKIISSQINSTPNDTLFDFPKLIHHEKEWTNFIKSGRIWVGENFENNPLVFKYEHHPPLKWINKKKIEFRACARSNNFINNKVSAIINNDTVVSGQISTVSAIYYNDYVKFTKNSGKINTASFNDSLTLSLFYHQTSNPLAWLDYFTLTIFERLVTHKNQLIFQLPNSNNVDLVDIKSNWESPYVWEVSQFHEPISYNLNFSDSSFQTTITRDTIRKFVVFNKDNLLTPTFIKKVSNQNLHSSSSTNYVIITVPQFKEQAKRLIALHSDKDSLSGAYYFTHEIYNEFSSGKKETTAIRNFIKMIYDKGFGTNNQVKYVLLLGDGSYDPKYRLNNNLNFIPTFQSENSVKLTTSYVTDDYFGLMDDGEGDYLNGDLLDIAVGRLPVNNQKEANNILDKIYEYYNIYDKSGASDYESKLLTSNGSWKNNILFIGDDEDFHIHMKQADQLGKITDTSITKLNIQKLFIDAFMQESTITGPISTQANKKLMEYFDEGALIVNYTGHGGELGWAEEQILLVDDIKGLKNRNKLPLLMTATCEFSRFDDPTHASAGEYLLLQPKGGAIALFTTVRLVFSVPNFRLNQTFYEVLKASITSNDLHLGDIFRKTKMQNSGGTNDRNFTLLGDPAIKLAFPSYNINTTTIEVNSNASDTLKALDQIKIKGNITDNNNQVVSNYNGWVELKIFDKQKPVATLNNDNLPAAFEFNQQEDLLFKGRAEVENGTFSIKAFLPKNTRPDYGFGKLSFYAIDEGIGDAAGANDSIIIGGINSAPNIDEVGPEVEIFLDDSTFSFGDATTSSPLFIAQLIDSSGINLVSNEFGKNITLSIDDDPKLTYDLSNYYIPSEKSYQLGEVLFPIEDLSTGRHNLSFKAYDNLNNSSEAYTEFIVEENAELALQHVLNYPNPFTTNTGFYFEHNNAGEDLKVLITIFTVSGKAIKTIKTSFSNSSKSIGPISWNGLDDYGDAIGRGVYVYKLEVVNSKNEKESVIEKLVLLK